MDSFESNANSHKDKLKTIKEKLILKAVDGKYIMNDKDVENLDEMIRLACINIYKCEKTNQQLKVKNADLEKKCLKYDQLIKELNNFKSKSNNINLYAALGRDINDKDDVINLIHTWITRENEYIWMENDKLKNNLNKQLINIRLITFNSYNEILSSLDKFKEELIIKNLKISQLMDDICLKKTENEKRDKTIKKLEEQLFSGFSQVLLDKNGVYDHDFQKINELNEGKLLIADKINQLEGISNTEVTNHRLTDLINNFCKSVMNKQEQIDTIYKQETQSIENQKQQLLKEIGDHKEWQKHLENENEQLISKIKNQNHIQKKILSQMNELNDLKKDYIQMQVVYDNLSTENMHFKILVEDYQQQLNEKHIKITDGENLIQSLKSNLIEKSMQCEKVNLKFINEKEKCQNIECQTQQMIEELTVQIHKKNNSVVLLQEECFALTYHIDSKEAEIDNLKQNVNTLEYALNEKNIIVKDMFKKTIKQNQYTPSQFDNLLHILSKLEQQMDITLDDLYICKKKLLSYESVFKDMQNIIQQQSTTRNNWIAKHKNVKEITNEKIMENLVEEKDILVPKEDDIENKSYLSKIDELKNEIQDLKKELKLKSSTIIITEKIAKLQLQGASNTIQHFSRLNNAQLIELNHLRNKVSAIKCTEVSGNTNETCSKNGEYD